MTSRRNLAGLAALGGLGLLALLGAILGWDWLIVFGLGGMIGVLGVIVLNTNTLLRSFRTTYDRGARNGGVVVTGPIGATASQDDLTGALRLLQAQYVGRLDRAQTTLEQAAAALHGRPEPAATVTDPIAALPEGSVLILDRIDVGTVAVARRAVDRGLAVQMTTPDSHDRELLSAAGLDDAVSVIDGATVRRSGLLVALPDQIG